MKRLSCETALLPVNPRFDDDDDDDDRLCPQVIDDCPAAAACFSAAFWTSLRDRMRVRVPCDETRVELVERAGEEVPSPRLRDLSKETRDMSSEVRGDDACDCVVLLLLSSDTAEGSITPAHSSSPRPLVLPERIDSRLACSLAICSSIATSSFVNFCSARSAAIFFSMLRSVL